MAQKQKHIYVYYVYYLQEDNEETDQNESITFHIEEFPLDKCDDAYSGWELYNKQLIKVFPKATN